MIPNFIVIYLLPIVSPLLHHFSFPHNFSTVIEIVLKNKTRTWLPSSGVFCSKSSAETSLAKPLRNLKECGPSLHCGARFVLEVVCISKAAENTS